MSPTLPSLPPRLTPPLTHRCPLARACSDGPVPPEACKEGLELWFVYKDILKKKDLKDKDKARAIKDVVPQVGDRVRFQLRQSKATGAMRAVMIEWVAAPEIDLSALDGPVEMGVVSVVKETFGFLRCLDRSARLFFHFSALPDPDRRPAVGDVLRFKVVADPRTSKDIAVACESLSPADVTQERVVAERAVGTVVATSGAPAWQAVEDGKVAVKTPGEWSGKHAVYSNWEFGRGGEDGAEGKDTREGKDKDKDPLDTLEEGDEVEMTLVWNDKTGALRATSLRLVKKAPLKEGWERGQVSSLKEKFGFVHSASQPVDLFFHQSFLEPPLTIDKVTVGMDVEYRPGMDNKVSEWAKGARVALVETR